MKITPNSGDDFEAFIELLAPVGHSIIAVGDYRVAGCLLKLRDQIDLIAPDRSKFADGTIGDKAHRSIKSDHNPHIRDGEIGVVTALDITHDPANGCNVCRIVEALRASEDPRIKYVIFNHQIFSSYAWEGIPPWELRSYAGSNSHEQHVHISCLGQKELYDSEESWHLGY